MRSARRYGIEQQRRLLIELSPDATQLTLEFRKGESAATEGLAPSIYLERDAAGRALRMRVAGLRRRWLTNAHLYQSVA